MRDHRGRNESKRHRYASAHVRIQAARDAGFYIEAIMICASIITDRLLSMFARMHEAGTALPVRDVQRMLDSAVDGDDATHISTMRMVKALEVVFDDLGEERFVGLPGRLQDWVRDRNRAAHAFVKTHPFTKEYREPLDDFIRRLDGCSEAGIDLSRTLDAWIRREKLKLP